MVKYVILTFFCLFHGKYSKSQSQNIYPEIGKPCPEFVLNEIHQYKSTSATNRDFKGKPLIVDFFSQYCSSCFESMPKINGLQQEFSGKVQFLLVGNDVNLYPGNKRNIREDYFSFQKHFNLRIPVVFDSITTKRFKIVQFSYVLWIDENGIVRAITSSSEINKERIQKLIDHHPLNLPLARNEEQLENDDFYNPDKRLLINGNGGNDSVFIYRSILMKWDPRQGYVYDFNLNSDNRENIQGVGMTAFALYRQAFTDSSVFFIPPSKLYPGLNHYGYWYLKPVFELKDSSIFKYDFSRSINVFSYNLTVPGGQSLKKMQRKMQSDLFNYFGFDVRVENREMPYWKLIATMEARKKLLTKGGKPSSDSGHSGFTFVNQPVSKLIWKLWSYDEEEIYIDETGISSNIDIDINAVLTDPNDFHNELHRQGLDLVRGTKEMKVIVFRDFKNDSNDQ